MGGPDIVLVYSLKRLESERFEQIRIVPGDNLLRLLRRNDLGVVFFSNPLRLMHKGKVTFVLAFYDFANPEMLASASTTPIVAIPVVKVTCALDLSNNATVPILESYHVALLLSDRLSYDEGLCPMPPGLGTGPCITARRSGRPSALAVVRRHHIEPCELR